MPIEVVDDSAVGFALRPYQIAALDAVGEGWRQGFTRQLLDMATGTGKTRSFSEAGKRTHERGKKTLILADRDHLVYQTAKSITETTGIEADVEKASDHASPYSPIVVASVQTLQNEERLRSFADDHFGLVVADECHHSLSNSWARILNYFHFGAHSLAEDWKQPAPGEPYEHKAYVLGVTATPDLMGDKHLNQFYQRVAFRYQLAEAIEDGWLVPIEQRSVNLKVDLRGLRLGKGSDFTDGALSKLMIPVVDGMADQLAEHARDRKTIAFVPSKECARLLAEAVARRGMKGIFVSGTCKDVDEKTADYMASGPGTVMANACLYKEAADFPDTSCIAQFRVTRSRSAYCQQTGRGTRPLKGVVDGLATAEERKAAIAASAKTNLLNLDPFWISDRLDLCNYFDLVTNDAQVKERMMAAPKKDLVEMVREAERDVIAAVLKEQGKHANKVARSMNPVAFALSVGDARLATYVPETAWEAAKPRAAQIEFIEKAGLNPQAITSSGLADKVIGILVERERLKLTTPKMIKQLMLQGFTEEQAVLMKRGQAGAIIGRNAARWRQ